MDKELFCNVIKNSLAVPSPSSVGEGNGDGGNSAYNGSNVAPTIIATNGSNFMVCIQIIIESPSL